MKTGNTLLSICVIAGLVSSLALRGQPSHDPIHVLDDLRPGVFLPASDPSNKGNWTVEASMSDEFNANELDPSRWRRSIVGWPGRTPALFVDHNVSVTQGTLQITMQKEPVDQRYFTKGYHDYTTGAVQSTRSVLYGYFEIRAMAMKSAASCGFWFSSKDQDNWNELDVAEMGGRPPADPRRVFMSTHVFEEHGLKAEQSSTRGATLGSNVSDGFHVYGLQWSTDWIDFYIDGRLQRHLRNTNWHTPANMILDAETQADWWGMPLDSDLPSVFTVDYVRAWKQAGQ